MREFFKKAPHNKDIELSLTDALLSYQCLIGKNQKKVTPKFSKAVPKVHNPTYKQQLRTDVKKENLYRVK